MEFDEARAELKEKYIEIGFDLIEGAANGLLFQIDGPIFSPVNVTISDDEIKRFYR